MILLSEEQLRRLNAAALEESYLLKIGVQLFILTLAAAFIVSMVILWLLIKSLRGIIKTVLILGDGDLVLGIPIQSKGELRVIIIIN